MLGIGIHSVEGKPNPGKDDSNMLIVGEAMTAISVCADELKG